VGNLSINHFVASIAETLFGGVKDSGVSHEGGTELLQCFTVVKNVSHITAQRRLVQDRHDRDQGTGVAVP